MPLSPAAAYIFVLLGLLLVYAEFIGPGAVLPGTGGLVLICVGAHGLWLCGLRAEGVALCAVAAALFSTELIGPGRVLAGGLPATVALMAASLTLCRTRVPPLLALAGGLIVGTATTVLLRTARRARRNKSLAGDHEAGTERCSSAYS